MANNKKDPQKRHRIGTVSRKTTRGLKHVWRYQPHPDFWRGSRQIGVWIAWKIPNLSMYHSLVHTNRDIKYIFCVLTAAEYIAKIWPVKSILDPVASADVRSKTVVQLLLTYNLLLFLLFFLCLVLVMVSFLVLCTYLAMEYSKVNSSNFGHQVESDIHLQTVEIKMRRRLLMSRLIRIFTVLVYFSITWLKNETNKVAVRISWLSEFTTIYPNGCLDVMGVLVLGASSSRCHGLVCSVPLCHFRAILTYFLSKVNDVFSHNSIKKKCQKSFGRRYIVGIFTFMNKIIFMLS